MKAALLTVYLTIAFLACGWFDAMDHHYVLDERASTSWVLTTAMGLGWPITLPMCLSVIAFDGGGRWHLASMEKGK